MLKPENYINIQAWMVTDLGLKGNELLLYAIIFGFCQEENSKYTGSLQYLADWINSSKQTVMNCLNGLIEKGLLEKDEKIINNIKFCEYHTKNLYGGGQKICMGVVKKFDPIIKNNNKDLKNIYMSEFEEFWKIYPKQRAGSKEKAYKAYCKVIQQKKITIDKLLEVCVKYAQSDEVKRGYAKGCAAWLNDERFNTEYTVKLSAPTFPPEQTTQWWSE